ncbi:uncharacterized protein LOC124849736 [Scophthalmus maximus]|uniref:uncharacterized protein LOC124849736 n=1 Tax=Scophthalmus maximus TaxID=52904 RepID=UPI001FA8DEEB|nr:uncharacterized protein LOC124849736 [Scophthalmus maximus]
MDAMDAVVPSHLSSPVKSSDAKCTKTSVLRHRSRAAASKPRRLPKQQAEVTPTVGSPQPLPAGVVEVVEEGGLPAQRTPRPVKGEIAADETCVSSVSLPLPIVTGRDVRCESVASEVQASMACSVVAAIKHAMALVCTWQKADIGTICAEGKKLVAFVAEDIGKSNSQCVMQLNVFGREWSVEVGRPMYTGVDFLEDDSEVYEKMQEHLLWGGMCLACLQGSICAIIDHGEYYAFVDSGTRSASGLAAGIGSPVAVFNTCLNDLMLHIRNLKKSLNVNWIGIGYMSVKEMADGASKEAAEEQGGRVTVESCNLESVQVTAETSGCQKVGKSLQESVRSQCAMVKRQRD